MFVQPNKETFQAATSNAEWSKAQSFNLMLTDQPGKDSWPITGAVFILMHKVQQRPENGRTSLQFFHWIYWNGQSIAEQLDFVPIPLDVVRLVECTWKEIKSIDNVAIWQRK